MHQPPSGFLSSSGVYRPMLRLFLRKPASGAVGDSCFPHGAGWWGSVPDGEGRPSGLGVISGNSQPPPASPSNPVSWSGASSQSGTSEGSQVNIWFKPSKPGLATVGSSGSVACANKTEASTQRLPVWGFPNLTATSSPKYPTGSRFLGCSLGNSGVTCELFFSNRGHGSHVQF